MKTTRGLKRTAAVAMAVFGLATSTHASIILSGNINTTGGSFQLTQDITFAITATGLAGSVILDNWVPSSDGNFTAVGLSPSSLSYQINGGSILTKGSLALRDNFNNTGTILTPNDGFLSFAGINVTSGDVLTLKAGTWTSAGNANFNPAALGTFQGNVRLMVTASGAPLSALTPLTPVPEPGAWAVTAGFAALAFGVWRRRASKA